MNPFDLKAVILAKHAQHVALVHFPIALIVVSVLFDPLSLRKQSLALLRAAYYTVIVAAISTVPTIATGLLLRPPTAAMTYVTKRRAIGLALLLGLDTSTCST